jgi:hypothetical protein
VNSFPAGLELNSVTPVVLSSLDNVTSGVVNVSDAISEQQHTQIINWQNFSDMGRQHHSGQS